MRRGGAEAWLSQAFFDRENILVLVGVFSQRFLIIGFLKIANSATPQTSDFLTQPLIRNLCPIKGKIGLEVPELPGSFGFSKHC